MEKLAKSLTRPTTSGETLQRRRVGRATPRVDFRSAGCLIHLLGGGSRERSGDPSAIDARPRKGVGGGRPGTGHRGAQVGREWHRGIRSWGFRRAQGQLTTLFPALLIAPGFRQPLMPEARFPKTPLLGSSVNRGNEATPQHVDHAFYLLLTYLSFEGINKVLINPLGNAGEKEEHEYA